LSKGHEGLLRFARNDGMSDDGMRDDEKKPAEAGF
jgi:hypothetical protein